MSATDMTDAGLPGDLDLDAALDRVLARHGELRRRRTRRLQIASGLGAVALMAVAVGSWRMADSNSRRVEIGSGVAGSSSKGAVDVPSDTAPGTATPEHDVWTGVAVPAGERRWRLELSQVEAAPTTVAPTTTALDPAAPQIGSPLQMTRDPLASPVGRSLDGRQLSLRYACLLGTQTVPGDAEIGVDPGRIVVSLSQLSGGSPCAADGLGAELRVTLPFDPEPGSEIVAEELG